MRGHWFILAAALLLAPSGAEARTRALAGGAPWQAQIYSNFTSYSAEELAQKTFAELAHRCGGSLIAPEWVLTAAHCISQEQVDKGYRVRLGATDLEAGDGISFRIDRLVRHPAYDPKTNANDIALIRLAADEKTVAAPAGKVAVIRLHGDEDDPPLAAGERVSATGWGKTAPGSDGRHSTMLMKVDLGVIDCASVPAYAGRTDGAMLCAGAPGKDSCQGDSGGPLILTYGEPLLVGVVSWGDGCADAARPGVYMRVAAYRDWIDRALAADPAQNAVD
ncbi:serine protease [Sphingomonas sp.]|uniref:S1 family serine peptidase n=1 Tax=Sphingomonas sp. TaxID=28214 RepID=UPI00286E2F69|nr:serine protease [Sphingomonas sp.]